MKLLKYVKCSNPKFKGFEKVNSRVWYVRCINEHTKTLSQVSWYVRCINEHTKTLSQVSFHLLVHLVKASWKTSCSQNKFVQSNFKFQTYKLCSKQNHTSLAHSFKLDLRGFKFDVSELTLTL